MPYKRFFPSHFAADETLKIMGNGSRKALKNSFSVLVWNIYKARKLNWDRDFISLIENIDLILLQEAVLGTRFDKLFQENDNREWVMARSHITPRTICETGVKTGCVVTSTLNLFHRAPDFEPIFKTPKMVLATQYPLEGSDHPLLVVNVHAINFVSLTKYLNQLRQIKDTIESAVGPVILAGDFNTWNKNRYSALLDLVKSLQLKELVLSRTPYIGHLFKDLDHIFYRGLQPFEAKITNVKTSDHNPICVKFKALN